MGKECLSNSNERFTCLQTQMGTGRAKVGVCQHKGKHFGVCLSAKWCCCVFNLSLIIGQLARIFCRLVACERTDCGNLRIYEQGEIVLFPETSFYPVIVWCCEAKSVPTWCKKIHTKTSVSPHPSPAHPRPPLGGRGLNGKQHSW